MNDPTHATQENQMPTLEQLTGQLATALENLESAKQYADAVKEQIRQHPDIQRGGPDKYQAGDATLTVSTNRRFDPKRAMPLIPEEILPLVSYPDTVIDKDKLKALLPEVYETAQTEGAYRIGLA